MKVVIITNKCVVLNFSSRNNGNCERISRYLQNYYCDNTEVFTIDAKNFTPCGDCNYECLKPDMVCPQLGQTQAEVMDKICASTLVYFVMPNYCGLPNANYFAFNERKVGYFGLDREKTKHYLNIRKRFIVVSNTEGFEKFLQQQTVDRLEILYLKTSKYGKQSIAGDILDSEAARKDLDAFLATVTH